MLEIMTCSGKSFFSSVTPWNRLKMIIGTTGRLYFTEKERTAIKICIIIRCEEERVLTFYTWLGINKIDNIVKKSFHNFLVEYFGEYLLNILSKEVSSTRKKLYKV